MWEYCVASTHTGGNHPLYTNLCRLLFDSIDINSGVLTHCMNHSSTISSYYSFYPIIYPSDGAPAGCNRIPQSRVTTGIKGSKIPTLAVLDVQDPLGPLAAFFPWSALRGSVVCGVLSRRSNRLDDSSNICCGLFSFPIGTFYMYVVRGQRPYTTIIFHFAATWRFIFPCPALRFPPSNPQTHWSPRSTSCLYALCTCVLNISSDEACTVSKCTQGRGWISDPMAAEQHTKL